MKTSIPGRVVEHAPLVELTGLAPRDGAFQLYRTGVGYEEATVEELAALADGYARALLEARRRIAQASATPLPLACEGSDMASQHEADVLALRRFAAAHATDETPGGAA